MSSAPYNISCSNKAAEKLTEKVTTVDLSNQTKFTVQINYILRKSYTFIFHLQFVTPP